MNGNTNHRHEDRGAALILAIGFVVMIGAISAGLMGLVTSSVNNRGSLEAIRDRQYAADGAIEEAVTQVRQVKASALGACALDTGTATSTLDTYAIRVDWQNACGVVRTFDGLVVAQRNVIFAACLDTGTACTDSSTIIRASVNFEQGAAGAVTKTYVQSWSVNQ